MPVDHAKAAEVQEWLQSKKGGEARIVNKLEEMTEGPMAIPVLSPTLTWSLSGGVRIGHWCRWYGPEGSGKSLTNWGLAYVAQNYPAIMTEIYEREIYFWESQNKKLATLKLKKRLKDVLRRFPNGMNVMLFDSEQRADETFIARIGVAIHPDKFLIVDQNVIEEIIKEIKGSCDAYNVFLIDSVSNCQSYAEANLDPGDYERGTAAAAWKRLRQVRHKQWDRRENTLIFVDQMRMQLGAQRVRAAPSQIRFIKHNISLDVEFDRGIKLYLDDSLQLTDNKDKASNDFKSMGIDTKQVAGLEMRSVVQKNSTGKPFRNGVMRFKFDMTRPATGELVQEVGFDKGYELLKIAEYYHVIEAGGGGMLYLLDRKFKRTKHKWKGEFRAIEALASNNDLSEELLTRIQIDT